MSLTVNSGQLLSPNCMNGAHKEGCLSVCLSPLNRHEAPLASCTSKAEREQNRWDIRGNYAQPIHLSILQSARASRFLSTQLKKSVMNEIDIALTLE